MAEIEVVTGPNMDAMVSELVMGFVWDEKRCRICGWPLFEDQKDGCTLGNCALRPAPKQRADAIPPYSTDLPLALSVLEKFEGYAIVKVCKDHPGMNIKAGQVQVTVWTSMTSDPVWVVSTSVPLGICLAALKARRIHPVQ